MRNYLFGVLIAMIITCAASISGCSGDKESPEKEPEKGAIKEMTDQTAHEILIICKDLLIRQGM